MYNTPLQPLPACFSLGPAAWFPHGLILLLLLLGEASWGDDAVGVWKMGPGRATFAADGLVRSFTLRIERHPRGEVLTSDLKMPVRKVRISYEVHIT